jgi:hypothetical protein
LQEKGPVFFLRDELNRLDSEARGVDAQRNSSASSGRLVVAFAQARA